VKCDGLCIEKFVGLKKGCIDWKPFPFFLTYCSTIFTTKGILVLSFLIKELSFVSCLAGGGSSLRIIIFIIIMAIVVYFLKNEGVLPFLG
jgi:hypothetical protein